MEAGELIMDLSMSPEMVKFAGSKDSITLCGFLSGISTSPSGRPPGKVEKVPRFQASPV